MYVILGASGNTGHIAARILLSRGKKVRAVTNVTYNAITTDFWGNLDAISGKESWQQFGLGGDAKGQPTQGQSVSHGAPWVRIKKIMVGAAFQ